MKKFLFIAFAMMLSLSCYADNIMTTCQKIAKVPIGWDSKTKQEQDKWLLEINERLCGKGSGTARYVYTDMPEPDTELPDSGDNKKKEEK